MPPNTTYTWKRESPVSRYLSELKDPKYKPPSSKLEDYELGEKAQKGDTASRNQLITRNLRFAAQIAFEYRGLGVPLEDLINEGSLGLVEAADRYDPEVGVKFVTYAVWQIRKNILRAIADQANTIRVPFYQAKKLREINEAIGDLFRELDRRPTIEEISEKLGRRIKAVEKAMVLRHRKISLDDTSYSESDNPDSLYNAIPDRNSRSPELEIQIQEGTEKLRTLLVGLPEKHKRVLMYKYGLDNRGDGRTLKEVGKMMSFSRERARQVQLLGLKKLRAVYKKQRAGNGKKITKQTS